MSDAPEPGVSPRAPRTPGARVTAAGCVLWRTRGAAVEVALVHRPRYDDWSFPKGKLDPGETLPACAAREVAEETGHTAWLGARIGATHYAVAAGPKSVHYWAAQAGPGEFAANDETDELRFVDVDKAAALLSHRLDAGILRRFAALGVPTSTLLLVRHAKAGHRAQWDGDDDLRPLSGTGRDQADRLAELLPLFGPRWLASAPPVRCADTLTPTAARLGMPVTEEPLLGEAGYWEAPQAGRARLHELATRPGTGAVCSQGGVIPDVVGDLVGQVRGRVGVDPADVAARKASTWVLTFTGQTLRAADYYESPTAVA